MASTKPIVGDWYDHPEYYDLSLRDETPQEAAFVEAACRKYCDFPLRRLVEPACGPGRLLVELAARGYHVTGLDLNEKALDYVRKRLKRRKLRAEVLLADMTDFTLSQPADAAVCLLNSFRHLLTESAAKSHLEAVAKSLRPGGIYILGLHLVPPDAYDNAIERWRASEGKTQISTDLRVTATDRRRRIERLQVSLLVRRGDRLWRFRGKFDFRLYTAAQIRKLLASVPAFELCDVYDFWYEINEPQKLNNEISDTVFILKKRG
ncbi:MAG: class I SAM-dependent methyltransferase [Thermoguttaceae bacterium]